MACLHASRTASTDSGLAFMVATTTTGMVLRNSSMSAEPDNWSPYSANLTKFRHPTVTRVADGEYGAPATRLDAMPSKTAARSGARSSRSKAGSRSGSRAARPAPRRKPAKSAHSVADPRRRAGHRPGCPGRLVDAGQGGRLDGPIGGPRPRHRSRPPPRRDRAGAAGHRGRRHREFVVRRRATGRRVDRQLPAGADRIGGPGVAGRAHRDRGRADAHRARPRRPAAADPRRGDDHPARAGPVAPVVRLAGQPGGTPDTPPGSSASPSAARCRRG